MSEISRSVSVQKQQNSEVYLENNIKGLRKRERERERESETGTESRLVTFMKVRD